MCVSEPNWELALIRDIKEFLFHLLQLTPLMFLSSSPFILLTQDPFHQEWLETHCRAKAYLELAILWPLFPVGLQANITLSDLCAAGTRPQDFCAEQTNTLFTEPPLQPLTPSTQVMQESWSRLKHWASN